MRYFNYFPKAEIPKLLDNEDWIDDSWYNDACPHVIWNDKNNINPNYEIIIWVQQCEGSMMDESSPMYELQIINKELNCFENEDDVIEADSDFVLAYAIQSIIFRFSRKNKGA